jgi:ribosomal protein L40E
MPIQIKCKCGKTLGIPDGMAGKAVKCPGCKQALRVPGGAASGKSPAAPARPAPPAANDFMQDLFDEEGFNTAVEAVCPSCRAEIPGNAVLCTKCGYHKESGTTLDAHKTAGVDIDHGTLALDKAAVDMASAVELQKRMLRGGGMPWWGLALTLFMLGSGLLIAVLAVNAERRVDETITFDPMQTFLTLSGSAFLAVANGALLMIFVHAFKQSLQQGFLCFLTPYVFYHVWTNWSETWRYFITLLIAASIGSGLMIAAVS